MTATVHIQAANGTDFYRQIATFAYGCHLEHGYGTWSPRASFTPLATAGPRVTSPDDCQAHS